MVKRYSSGVIERFNNPKHIGKYDEDDISVGVGRVGSLSCGDLLHIHVKFAPSHHVVGVRILVFGCGSALAAAERAAEMAKGRSMEDLLRIKNSEISEYLDLPRIKRHCSVLAEEALLEAVVDYCRKNNVDIPKGDSKETYAEQKKKDAGNCCESVSLNDFSKRSENKQSLTLTDRAKSALGEFFKTRPDKVLKIFVVRKGCGYTITYAVSEPAGCETFHIHDIGSFKVCVEKSVYLDALEVDLYNDGLEQKIRINSKIESGRCGCGMTFK